MMGPEGTQGIETMIEKLEQLKILISKVSTIPASLLWSLVRFTTKSRILSWLLLFVFVFQNFFLFMKLSVLFKSSQNLILTLTMWSSIKFSFLKRFYSAAFFSESVFHVVGCGGYSRVVQWSKGSSSHWSSRNYQQEYREKENARPLHLSNIRIVRRFPCRFDASAWQWGRPFPSPSPHFFPSPSSDSRYSRPPSILRVVVDSLWTNQSIEWKKEKWSDSLTSFLLN